MEVSSQSGLKMPYVVRDHIFPKSFVVSAVIGVLTANPFNCLAKLSQTLHDCASVEGCPHSRDCMRTQPIWSSPGLQKKGKSGGKLNYIYLSLYQEQKNQALYSPLPCTIRDIVKVSFHFGSEFRKISRQKSRGKTVEQTRNKGKKMRRKEKDLSVGCKVHGPGIEPGSAAWQAAILPLDQPC